jgi:cobalamin biosynthesis protein CobT
MLGVKEQPLRHWLDDKFHRGKFDEITDRADAPIEDAVAMMVRERLTGEQPPPAAKKLVDLWRPFIEERAGKGLDQLNSVVEDQRRVRRRGARSAGIARTWARTAPPPRRRKRARAATRTARRTRPARRATPPSRRTWTR